MENDVHASLLTRIFRTEYGRILSSLLLLTRDIQIAEDSMQDAFVEASSNWPVNGPPNKPEAWLLTIARRKLIDRIRREQVRRSERSIQAIIDTAPELDKEEDYHSIPDERLRLLFTCAHPALAEASQVQLTLKTLCGLNSREIARAFLSAEATVNKRLSRAKRKIRDAGIPYRVPEGEALDKRLPSVLACIYLMYNESYSVYEGQTLTRRDLANESIRLARLLNTLLPEPETHGLLSLLLLHDAREPSRSSSIKKFIPLQYQDRSLWRKDYIQEGTQLVLTSLALGKPGSYQVQAAISALHGSSPSWEATDWQQIQLLYEVLNTLAPSPIVSLNQAMSHAYGGNVERAYGDLLKLKTTLHHYQPYHVSLAELEQRRGALPQAIQHLEKALSLTTNQAESDYLNAKKSVLQKKLDHKQPT